MPTPFGSLALPGCITAGVDSHLFLPTGSDYINNSLLKEIAKMLQYLWTRSVTSKHGVSNTLSHSDFRRCLVGSQLWVCLGNLKFIFNGLKKGLARTFLGRGKMKGRVSIFLFSLRTPPTFLHSSREAAEESFQSFTWRIKKKTNMLKKQERLHRFDSFSLSHLSGR